MTIEEGSDFAGYRVERRLGAGGMGEVYLARHPRLPRHDALKILSVRHAGDAGFRAGFLREAEVAVRLQHPNVVAVRDRGEHDGRLWIAMQYVGGGDVAALIRRAGAVPVERAVRIIAEAAEGLDEIHRVGLQHRDVKPANLLLAEEPGQPDRVLVTDFGIARPAEAAADGDGGFTATLAYAAPEVVNGDRVDHRADVYSLGCTLYQLLTGTVPFPRSSPAAVMYAHLHEDAAPPSRANDAVPAAVDAVVARALAKDPADRYQSCGELAGALAAAVAGPAAPAPRRSRRIAAWSAAAAVVLVAVALTLVLGAGDGEPATSAARTPVATNSAAWGAVAFVAEAFPGLLPVAPTAVGYQELNTCLRTDQDSQFVPFDQVVAVGGVVCVGNREPADIVLIACNTDRTPIAAWKPMIQIEGEERWTRGGATGRVRWGTVHGEDGLSTGRLDVTFDAPARNFCRLRVGGGKSGTVLREQWWPDAPL
ncbi:serine/threonine-protein kinase [Nocardia thailandica]|uniref:serine/threonine-protein kinase n=1 Tax=Nocardia thailandica TaxID=257275 RepID=UPI0002F40300|nr:serine/threonine-protein kinase [Nocardia thailandica]